MKRCPKCQAIKAFDDFYRNKAGCPGAYCKPCTKADVHRWVRENPDKFRVNQRRSFLKRRYGLTEADVTAMLAKQQERCPICRVVLTSENLNIDHDHETGRVRGILCDRCNRTIGLLRDDPRVIRAAIAYLKNRRNPDEVLF